jgi:hypothetical protein
VQRLCCRAHAVSPRVRGGHISRARAGSKLRGRNHGRTPTHGALPSLVFVLAPSIGILAGKVRSRAADEQSSSSRSRGWKARRCDISSHGASWVHGHIATSQTMSSLNHMHGGSGALSGRQDDAGGDLSRRAIWWYAACRAAAIQVGGLDEAAPRPWRRVHAINITKPHAVVSLRLRT